MLLERKIKSNLTEKYNLIKKDIKAFLVLYGFSANKSNYEYKSGENKIVLSLQKSNTSNKNELKFTINCGIYSNIIYDYQKNFHETISAVDCHWNKRIGFFTKENKDLWYIISEKSILDAKEIISTLDIFVLPELFTLVSDKELLKTWEDNINTRVTEFDRLYYIFILNKHYYPDKSQLSLIKFQDYAIQKSINLNSFVIL
jgi:hypothetical protein